MILPEPLIPGTLIRRYKRFLADIRLENGDVVTVHCANSGSMTGLLEANGDVLLSESANPRRKYRYSWELVKVKQTWVVVNTARPNHQVEEAIAAQQIPELAGYAEIQKEVVRQPGSRLDILLKRREERCFVEVKNVTLVENRVALFPDAVTSRGRKHLQELIEIARSGDRAVIFFLVNRSDAALFRPAVHVDPAFAAALREAMRSGVEILAYQTVINPPEIAIERRLPLELET